MNDALLEATDLAATTRSAPAAGRSAPRQPCAPSTASRSGSRPAARSGLVGELGCGKSTTGKLVLGLIPATAGAVRYAGNEMPPAGSAAWRALRPRMQMVYQDPLGALDRRLPVGVQIMEPLAIHGAASPAERRERAAEVMAAVGLQRHQFDRYPHELSGGQRQRVVLARALMTEPDLLVCDEPISALDVSIQAQVVNLLLDLQERLGIAYLFISHDLRVVRQVSHEVAVMYLGRIVEQGEAESLFAQPTHPYTRALVSAIPVARPAPRAPAAAGRPAQSRRRAVRLRLPYALPVRHRRSCRAEAPVLRPPADGRQVACHRVDEPRPSGRRLMLLFAASRLLRAAPHHPVRHDLRLRGAAAVGRSGAAHHVGRRAARGDQGLPPGLGARAADLGPVPVLYRPRLHRRFRQVDARRPSPPSTW